MPRLNGHVPPQRRRRGRPVGSDSAETRHRILQAARQVILERGYHAATFQSIAEAAELSRPTLHYYFASREQIYESLVGDVRGAVCECLDRAGQRATLRDQLGALVGALHELDKRDRSVVAFLVTARLEASRNPELCDGGGAELRTFLATHVEAAAARGELRADTAVEPVVDLLLSMILGVGFYAGFVSDAADMTSITKQLNTVMLNGLLDDVTVS